MPVPVLLCSSFQGSLLGIGASTVTGTYHMAVKSSINIYFKMIMVMKYSALALAQVSALSPALDYEYDDMYLMDFSKDIPYVFVLRDFH